jgi:hypothetical protein
MEPDHLHRFEESSSPSDRREFLKAAAAVPTALGAAQALASPADKPQPAGAMPQIRLGGHMISRLIVGCHDIDGGGHVSPFLQRETREYYTPERAVATLQRCEAVGINAWHSRSSPQAGASTSSRHSRRRSRPSSPPMR